MARQRKATVPHGERYSPEELWSAGNEAIDAGLALMRDGRGMKRLAESSRCQECTVLIEIPLNGSGKRIVDHGYATHELGCPEHYRMPE